MQKRKWVEGVTEELDSRQVALLNLVYSKIKYYYDKLYQRKYAEPLSLSRLMKLTNRSGQSLTLALRFLANSVAEGEDKPKIWYRRIKSEKDSRKRYYQIYFHNTE